MTLIWGLPMVGPYCFTRGGAMQMRRQDLLLVPPLPRLAFLQMPKLCPTPSLARLLLPLTRSLSSAAPRCPHPLCNLRGINTNFTK